MRKIDGSLPETVFMSDWPETDEKTVNKELDSLWDKVMKLRGAVSRALEQSRAAGLIGQSLEACVQVKKLKNNAELDEIINAFTEQELEEICIVSKFSWDDGLNDGITDKDTEYVVKVIKAADTMRKCPRCWRYFNDNNELCPRCAEVMKG